MLSSAADKMKLRWEEVPGSQPQVHPPTATHMTSDAKFKCPPPSHVLVLSEHGTQRTKHCRVKGVAGETEITCNSILSSSKEQLWYRVRRHANEGMRNTGGYQDSRTEEYFSVYSERRGTEEKQGRLTPKLW